ncbi:hypothetical protein JRO89_XS05G0152300 [Xanthoceras sorbifolium]|uniref:Uncharacterized protein n=1 Tax=Xanthoceras sorbifolium TaxID=99658 RepID=A0ABQ8I230_9ROSI|nr:hypothetical protein JRO89_XS05G0152200 [Xanthoceras sorbifolium]KAH7570661.1 hypothetical protein JRO89_XS05G0152300 [Xanthoceras sorbifolium]
MTAIEAPILSRLDRLDNVLRQLEEIRSCNRSPKSSTPPSTRSSGTLTSDGRVSSVEYFSPRSLEKHCRPIDHVVMETEVKGTLIERLHQVEDRVMKMEGELAAEKQSNEEVDKKANNKGLKQFVKHIFKGKGKHKSRTN